ncbi:hypothetical protein CRL37_07575 [Campylobacter coli]|nr:hypothetical protein [Campylobacter coli]EAJ5092324.1 hypothetical protein [Campylobacter coli]EAK4552345.1 hypothetical protein [Campylobacter coli]
MLSNHYTVISVKKIRTNKSRPSFKKQIEFKKLYGIPYEFWVDVRSNLINIPKRGRKRKDRE